MTGLFSVIFQLVGIFVYRGEAMKTRRDDNGDVLLPSFGMSHGFTFALIGTAATGIACGLASFKLMRICRGKNEPDPDLD